MGANALKFFVILIIFLFGPAQHSAAKNLLFENLTEHSNIQTIFKLELESRDQHFIIKSLTGKGFSCGGVKRHLNERDFIHCIYHGCNRKSLLKKRYTLHFRSVVGVSVSKDSDEINLMNSVMYVPELSMRCEHPSRFDKVGDQLRFVD